MADTDTASDTYADKRDADLRRFAWRESGNQNIPQRSGGPASGLFQMEDSSRGGSGTWEQAAEWAGLPRRPDGTYGRAMDYTEAEQWAAARALYDRRGSAPWNASSSAAMAGLGGYGSDMVARTMGDVRGLFAQREAAQAPILNQMQEDYQRNRQRYQDIAKDYQPMQETKPPPVPANDPLAAFGSAASIFAALASAFTHTPAINAMNGMAAAINGAKQANWEQYAAGYKQWKDNTELALERHRQQAEDMRTAMELMQTDIAAGTAAAKAVGAKYEDAITLQTLELGQYEHLSDHLLATQQAATSMKEASVRVEELNQQIEERRDRHAALTALNQTQPGTPEYTAALDKYLAIASPASLARPGSSPDLVKQQLFEKLKRDDPTMSDADARLKAEQLFKEAGAKPSSPVVAQVDGPDGPSYTLAQQMPNGQWVSADEKRTPLSGVVSVAKSEERPAPNDPTVEKVAKAIAEYRLAPLSSFVQKTPWGQAVMARSTELNPDYEATQYGARAKAARDFATGTQGQKINSFNVAISHLDTLGELADALKNNDVQAVNKLANAVAAQTGSPAPTNFNTAKQIVGQEIIKSIIGGGGGVTERQEAEQQLSTAQSPAQLKGVISTYKQLMAGQLSGLRQQYEQTTGLKNFDDRLSPEARREVGHLTIKQLPMIEQNGRRVPDASQLKDGEVYVLPNGRHARFDAKTQDFVPE